MAEERTTDSLPVTVTLDVPRLLLAPGATAEAIRTSVASGVSSLMQTLGIPGHAVVELTIGKASSTGSDRLRLAVDGTEARYPRELLPRVCGEADDQLLGGEVTIEAVCNWIERGAAAAEATSTDGVATFLRGLSVEILKCNPSLLLGALQLATYEARVSAATIHFATQETRPLPEGAWLKSVLDEILDLGISISDVATVAQVISDGLAIGRPKASIVEDLVEMLRPHAIKIELPRRYLRTLSTRWHQDAGEVFSSLREQLFEEIGVSLPSFQFAIDDNLKPGHFAFRINHLASIPLRGLDTEQTVVDEPAAETAIAARSALRLIDLTNGRVGTVVTAEASSQQASRGWNQLQYLVLCMADLLRENAWRLVTREETRDQLRTLQAAFPALVATAYAIVPDDEITRTRRALVRAGVAVRNLRGALEPLVERRILQARGAHAEGDSALSVARSSLVPELAYKLAGEDNDLRVFVIHLESADGDAALQSGLDEGDAALVAALSSEIARMRLAAPPALLTPRAVRRQVERLLAVPFPRIAVFSRDELPSEIRVQEIGRIQPARVKAAGTPGAGRG